MSSIKNPDEQQSTPLWAILITSGLFMLSILALGIPSTTDRAVYNSCVSQSKRDYDADTVSCKKKFRGKSSQLKTCLAQAKKYKKRTDSLCKKLNSKVEPINTIQPVIEVQPVEPCIPVEDTDNRWTFSGSWLSASGEPWNSSNRTLTYTTDRKASASINLRGTGFIFTYSKGPTNGSFAVYVNGGKVAVVNAYSAKLEWLVAYRFDGLQDGIHKVEIRHEGPSGSIIDLDKIEGIGSCVNRSDGATATLSSPVAPVDIAPVVVVSTPTPAPPIPPFTGYLQGGNYIRGVGQWFSNQRELRSYSSGSANIFGGALTYFDAVNYAASGGTSPLWWEPEDRSTGRFRLNPGTYRMSILAKSDRGHWEPCYINVAFEQLAAQSPGCIVSYAQPLLDGWNYLSGTFVVPPEIVNNWRIFISTIDGRRGARSLQVANGMLIKLN